MILALKIIAIWLLLNALIAVLATPPRAKRRSDRNDEFEKEGRRPR